MRPLVALALILTLVSSAGAMEYYDVTLRNGTNGAIVVALGDLNGRPLGPTIITSLSFLAAWAKTGQPSAPVTIGHDGVVLPIPLLLPAVGFALMSETPLSAVVRVGHLTVQAQAAPYTSSALLTLERVNQDAPWTVTAVTVQ